MNRRDSIHKFVLAGTVLFLAPSVFQSCTKEDETDPDQKPEQDITVDISLPENVSLNNSGGSKIIQSILVANTGSGYIALSSICTHLGCTVGYNLSANKIKCPCHGSEFETSGSVIQGPASTPLRSYPVTKSGNILTIHRS